MDPLETHNIAATEHGAPCANLCNKRYISINNPVSSDIIYQNLNISSALR